MLKSIVRAAGAAVRAASVVNSPTTRTLPFSCAALCSPCSAATRPFTRSLWMLSNNGASSGYRPKLFSSNVMKPPVSCGCGGLHTDGGLAENLASNRTSLASTKQAEASLVQWKPRVTGLRWRDGCVCACWNISSARLSGETYRGNSYSSSTGGTLCLHEAKVSAHLEKGPQAITCTR